MNEWIDPRHEVPAYCEEVLVIARFPIAGIETNHYALAFYTQQGWILEDLEVIGAEILCWIPLPDMPEEVNL